MENTYLISGIIAIVFLIFKFVEIQFIKKENLVLKSLIVDTIIVFVSAILGLIIFEQFNNNIFNIQSSTPQAFTSTPEF